MLTRVLRSTETPIVPRREGEEIEFIAHGLTWRIKCLGRATWTLYTVRAGTATRCRFGDRSEISEDLAHVLLTGVLPGKPGRP